MAKHNPGKLLCLVAVVSGVIDLGCGLYGLLESLFSGGMLWEFGILLGSSAMGLAVLAAVAIQQSAAGRHVLAWLAVAPAAMAAYLLLGAL